ncbi:MAG TPA: histidine kinase [Candidatus Limnocylindrales bacterium]
MDGDRSGKLERLAPWALGAAVFVACFYTPQESPLIAAQPGANRYYLEIQSLFDADSDPIGFLLIAVLSAAAVVLAWRVRWPIYVMAVIAWLLFALWPVAFVATYVTAVSWTRRRRLIWYLAIACTLISLPFLVGDNFSHLPERERTYAFGLFTALTVVIPAFAGLWIRTRRRVIAALVESNARLQGEQEARQDQARVEERNRIAREMHDVVANRIALIVMHAGALQLGTHKESVVSREATLIGELGRTALMELREVLGVLRKRTGEYSEAAPAEPLPAQLATLAAQARAAGVTVEYRVEGETLDAPVDAARIARERTVFRVAQEALTNVMKHAEGARTVLTLRRSPHTLEVTVENGPPARPPSVSPLPSSGLGLVGLRERIAVQNGRIETGPRPDGGYIVHAVLPG